MVPQPITLYKVVTGPAYVEVMTYVSLDDEQWGRLARLVEGQYYENGRRMVRAYDRLEFQTGEVIGLISPPTGELTGALEEVPP